MGVLNLVDKLLVVEEECLGRGEDKRIVIDGGQNGVFERSGRLFKYGGAVKQRKKISTKQG